MDNANRGNTAFIVLMHDIWASTVYQLVNEAIDYVHSRGYQVVDMGTCMTGRLNGCYQ